MQQLKKVKKHKTVVFAEEPIIIEYDKYILPRGPSMKPAVK